MAGRVIVVLPLLRDNRGDGGNGGWIMATETSELMLKVPEYDALYRHCSCSNGVCAAQTGNDPKHETTDATEPITPAAPTPAA